MDDVGNVLNSGISHFYIINFLINSRFKKREQLVQASAVYGIQGDNVKKMNTIRTELDATGSFALPFGQRMSYAPLNDGM